MRKCRAFTLIELIAAIVVIGIIAAAGAPILFESVTAYNDTLNEIATLDRLRYASDRMAREFREINWNGSQFQITSTLNTSPTPATTASFTRKECLGTSTCATLTSYVVTISQDTSKVYLTYQIGGTNYQKTLADNLRSLTFTYYDSTLTANPTAITVRYVDILLTLTANGQNYSQKTRVALRNH